ncbi:hypothetical protein DTL42_01080 [Bremerella cremea]|uniref:Uncharacterized protein n=1 Tax=Bremerella cremea TaxID=1031537 RepID=A0A368KXR6_9BACT|nr:hypothetical protein [Bremerella cremea]RCS56011.1 hypothetical protein DTL42_01080 [Bremerella cremea]
MSNKLRRFWIVLSLLVFPLLTSAAFAQDDTKEEEEGKSWVLNYITVVLLVGAGVGIVGMGTNRENEEMRKKERKEAQEKEERLKKLEQG